MASSERLKTGWFCDDIAISLIGAALCVAGACFFFSGSSLAAVATPAKATTSRAAREDALRTIPFSQLSKPAHAKIATVVRDPSMYRRMPISVIDCDPELHLFLVRYPEVIVNIWQLMGITKVAVERTGPYQLECADGVGTVTDLELVYGNRDTHLIYCEGSYEGPLFRKPVTGRCVLLLKSGSVRTAAGRHHVTNRLDVFLQIDHAGIDVFTKTLHPLLGRSADVNFLESMKFLQRISRAAEMSGSGMQQLSDRLEAVQPEIRQQFSNVVASVHARSGDRVAKARPSDETTSN